MRESGGTRTTVEHSPSGWTGAAARISVRELSSPRSATGIPAPSAIASSSAPRPGCHVESAWQDASEMTALVAAAIPSRA
ncbi:MAG: hypothetical protein ACRDOO_17505 [Actinomadura sp.]